MPKFVKRKRTADRPKYNPYPKKGKWAARGSYKRDRLTQIIKKLARADLEKHRSYLYLNASAIATDAPSGDYKCVVSSAVTTAYPLTRDEGGGISNGKTRTGSKIYVNSIRFNGTFLHNSSGSSSVIRMLIWRQNKPGNYSSQELLAATNSGYLQVYAPYNRDNAGRDFEILYDKTWILDVSNTLQQRFDFTLKNVGEITYTGPAATDWNKGMICMTTIADRISFVPTVYCGVTAVFQDV